MENDVKSFKLNYMKIKFIVFLLTLSLGIGNILAKQRALLIGIGDYDKENTGWDKLSGNNDVNLLQNKLKKLGFEVNSLKDSKATKKNIIGALSQLVSKVKPGDIVYIHFSGHGQPISDMNNDEPDGWDQSFVCYDACNDTKINGNHYNGQNHLIDDEFFPYVNELKTKLGEDGKIFIAFDSCYSEGTVRGGIIEDSDPDSETEYTLVVRGTNDKFPADDITKEYLSSIKSPEQFHEDGAEVVIISACGRNNRNWETKEIRSGKNYGSLSYCLSKMIDDNVSMDEWADFFEHGKYKSYKIFRDSQHPVVEIH